MAAVGGGHALGNQSTTPDGSTATVNIEFRRWWTQLGFSVKACIVRSAGSVPR